MNDITKKQDIRRWPNTPDELINETKFYFNKLIKDIKSDTKYEIKPRELSNVVEFIIRSKHVMESISNKKYIDENNKMLEQLIEILKKQNIITMVQKRFEDHIISYRGWVDILFSLEKKEDLEEYDNLLYIRDALQAEIEVLEIMNINLQESIERIIQIDQDFKSIGPKLGYVLLNKISMHVFPEKIYWWWYLGGINDK
jgi:tRNA nucleotidyltransferase/poly(A) polymerase